VDDIKELPSKYDLKDFIPVRLNEAIIARGYARNEVAEAAEITTKQLCDILMQGKGITLALVIEFSTILDFPVRYFFKPLPPRSIYVDSITFDL
jgi:DNA-binding Xre family transcriptional regulator